MFLEQRWQELSEGIRGQIIALSNEGLSQRKIAEKIKVSKGAACAANAGKVSRIRIVFYQTKIWEAKSYHYEGRSVP